jgi:hypothetical protein
MKRMVRDYTRLPRAEFIKRYGDETQAAECLAWFLRETGRL